MDVGTYYIQYYLSIWICMNFTYQILTMFLCFNLCVHNDIEEPNWCIIFILRDFFHAS